MESTYRLFSAILLTLGICALFHSAAGEYSQYYRQRCLREKGQFQHLQFCNWYYNCWNGDIKEEKCQNNLYFSTTTERCEWSAECYGKPVAASNVQTTQSYKCPYAEGLYRDYTDCSAYYTCRNWQPTRNLCFKGQLFNGFSNQCSHPRDVDCAGTYDPTGLSAQYYNNRNPNQKFPVGSYPQPGTFGGGYATGPLSFDVRNNPGGGKR